MTAGAKWKRQVNKLHRFDGAQLATVELAAQALDRAEAAQKAIDKDGVMVDGLHGQKIHPACILKRDAVQEYVRLAKLLGIFTPDIPTDDNEEES